jgi:hypothetical protein
MRPPYFTRGILMCDYYVLDKPIFRLQGMYQRAVMMGFRDFPTFPWNI